MAHSEPPQLPSHRTYGAGQAPFPGTSIPAAPLQFALPAYSVALVPVRPSRVKYYVGFVLLTLLGGVVGYLLAPRAGVLELSVKPPDARLAVDGIPVNGTAPFRIKQRAGVHRLTLSRPGYVGYAETVLISSGQRGQMDVALAPSPDTGFKLTSTPPGGLVFIDGQPLVLGTDGRQATTDVLASRIAPGPHQVEIKGDPRFLPWAARFEQEPARTVVLHAELLPAPAAGPSPSPRPGPRASAPAAAAPVPAPAPAPAEARPPAASASGAPGEDPFDKPLAPPAAPAATRPPVEREAAPPAAASKCVATIGSNPPAELFIDGEDTGKTTPLVGYELSCGTHRLTFRNKDLLIERNERITLAPGRAYKKIFQLASDDLF